MNIVTSGATFDQPLYIKAVEIVKSASLNGAVRLGGLHTLMSFFGKHRLSHGGSGLENIFET